MHRRKFSTGFVAAALAMPTVLTARTARAEALGHYSVAQFGRVTLDVNTFRGTVSQLLIATPVSMFGVDLRTPISQFNEHRLSYKTTPMLESLFRQPLKDRFSPADPMGQVFLHQRQLIVVAQNAPVSNISGVVIAHRKLSWEPKTGLRRVAASHSPNLDQVQSNGTLLGSAHQTESELLIHVRPSVVDIAA